MMAFAIFAVLIAYGVPEHHVFALQLHGVARPVITIKERWETCATDLRARDAATRKTSPIDPIDGNSRYDIDDEPAL